ncbi:MAG: hypothetical protein JJU25_07625 [Halomonas sp.]|nr:hypothetical protein [Halomonas sp.]MCC5882489.1 hypothetical protein [Halomonas sp.]
MKYNLLVLGFVLLVTFISAVMGDWLYAVRMVQSGRHEPLFILLGLVLGFTMRASIDEDSISALICAIGMAVLGLLVGGLDITNPGSAIFGFLLTALFFSAMLGTVVFLLRALRKRIPSDNPDSST